jgi:hypothetical protein
VSDRIDEMFLQKIACREMFGSAIPVHFVSECVDDRRLVNKSRYLPTSRKS